MGDTKSNMAAASPAAGQIIKLKAVVFDIGNVLTHATVCSQDMAQISGVERSLLERWYWHYRSAYDLGTLDGRSYWQSVYASASGAVLSAEQVDKLIKLDTEDNLHPHHTMVAWAKTLQSAGFKTAVISNMPPEHCQYLRSKCEWIRGFHHYAYSGELKCAKPGREIYQHCLAALGLGAPETLFIDDRPENIAAAKELGMHGLLFTVPAQLVADLSGRFDLPLPAIN